MTIFRRFVLFFLVFSTLVGTVYAAGIPEIITIQGKLSDSGGTAITTAVDLQFRIYNVSSGGTAVWSTTRSGVVPSNGLFSIILGEEGVDSVLDVNWDKNYWIGVTVSSDSEMTPRIRISSVPFALTAKDVFGGYVKQITAGANIVISPTDGNGIVSIQATGTLEADFNAYWDVVKGDANFSRLFDVNFTSRLDSNLVKVWTAIDGNRSLSIAQVDLNGYWNQSKGDANVFIDANRMIQNAIDLNGWIRQVTADTRYKLASDMNTTYYRQADANAVFVKQSAFPLSDANLSVPNVWSAIDGNSGGASVDLNGYVNKAKFDTNFWSLLLSWLPISDNNLNIPNVWSAIDGNKGAGNDLNGYINKAKFDANFKQDFDINFKTRFDGNFWANLLSWLPIGDANLSIPNVWSAIDGNSGGASVDLNGYWNKAKGDANVNALIASRMPITDLNLSIPNVWTAIDGNSGGSSTDTTIDTNTPALNSFLRKGMNFSGAIDFNSSTKIWDLNIYRDANITNILLIGIATKTGLSAGDLNMSGNLYVKGDINAGNVKAGKFFGDGAGITGVTAAADLNGEDINPNLIVVGSQTTSGLIVGDINANRYFGSGRNMYDVVPMPLYRNWVLVNATTITGGYAWTNMPTGTKTGTLYSWDDVNGIWTGNRTGNGVGNNANVMYLPAGITTFADNPYLVLKMKFDSNMEQRRYFAGITNLQFSNADEPTATNYVAFRGGEEFNDTYWHFIARSDGGAQTDINTGINILGKDMNYTWFLEIQVDYENAITRFNIYEDKNKTLTYSGSTITMPVVTTGVSFESIVLNGLAGSTPSYALSRLYFEFD